MTKIKNFPNRLQVLAERRERIIYINNGLSNQYFGNDAKIAAKKSQAQRMFAAIREEKSAIETAQYATHKTTPEHKAIMATKGLNGLQILTLNK